MKLQHYLGGLENLGPVSVEKQVFVEEWEKRIFGIHTVMMAESAHLSGALPKYPVDSLPTAFKSDWTWASLRTGAEGMQPFDYFKFRYYEKWLMGISGFFVDQGYISGEDLKSRAQHYRKQPDAPLPDQPSPAIREQIVRYLHEGDSGLRPYAGEPLLRNGASVKVADPVAVDHTRLPGYLRNKPGTIVEVYAGAFAYFVNTGPDGIGEPMPVYRVAFNAADIWGEGKSEANTTIYADLFEAYLQPAV
ncbi:nitrile hydratase [Pseudomonas sp. JUb42]|jgi:nitrile hydratase|uniref:nitrile hydratase subunit beta n=1 Tax=Pseudomonas sp. JUb42 TaxID=2940611 RepID=UPI002168B61D|nr:nitrile hydratase subunit beta [Pseudomonas sp. JUb42]MCS3472678.1 nitrile hydratase [Pseudomonas sp. JUb42]